MPEQWHQKQRTIRRPPSPLTSNGDNGASPSLEVKRFAPWSHPTVVAGVNNFT